MKYFVLVAALLLMACAQTEKAPTLVGADKDVHGCIGSAGYSWCEEKQKCLRPWEENCTTEATAPATAPTAPTDNTPAAAPSTTPTTADTTPAPTTTTPDINAIAPAKTCTEEWKCKTPNSKAYLYPNCNYGPEKQCPGGCLNGECQTPTASQVGTVLTNTGSTSGQWVCNSMDRKVFKAPDGTLSNSTHCQYGCKNGICNTGS